MLRSSSAIVVSEARGLRRGKTPRVLALALVALVVGLSVLVVGARPVHAAPTTFTVNSTDDTDDGACTALVVGRGFECTLREAINAANSNDNATETDRIHFNIPGSGVRTISPTSPLPTIVDRVAIDGYTQPGATENTNPTGAINANLLIELSGTNAGNANGLLFADVFGGTTSAGSVVRGLVINRFQGSGIIFTKGPGCRAEGNFIGTDPSGEIDLGNGFHGVDTGGGTIIGGTTPETRNLISGNGSESANSGDGVAMVGSSDNTVQGNLIGTGKDGVADLGNDGNGVKVLSGARNLISSNRIAFNGKDDSFDGVSVLGGGTTGNRILRNSIFSNGGLGIDLLGPNEDSTTSVTTANDGGTADDADTGPNGLQNKPVLTSATTTTIAGFLDSKPDTPFTVQFFSQPGGNEGKRFLGQVQVPRDPDGRFAFSFSPPANAVAVGQKITATATGPEGTSEFSAIREVTAS